MSRHSSRSDDALLWLEDIDSDRALDWVHAQNTLTFDAYTGSDDFEHSRARLLSIYQSDQRIPFVSRHGAQLYNFWRDDKHERGIYRRTTFQSYEDEDTLWETVLDLDALSAAESENWVLSGVNPLQPVDTRVLIELSRGGSDASVHREFDLTTKQFISNGFNLPEAKSRVGWIDRDTVFVATDFGDGSLSDSGYPRIVKRWRRGTPLQSAELVHEAPREVISVGAMRDQTPGFETELLFQKDSFFSQTTWLIRDGEKVLINIAADANPGLFKSDLLVSLRSDWQPEDVLYSGGSLLIINFESFLSGDRRFDVLFSPTTTRFMEYWFATRSHIVIQLLDNVKTSVEVHKKTDSGWICQSVIDPQGNALHTSPFDHYDSDDLWLTEEGYLTPQRLSLHTSQGERRMLAQSPRWFDDTNLSVSWHEAISKDGTSVPFARISHQLTTQSDATPTILYGYGGFEVSLLPGYSGTIGASWLEQGGSYVVANIRGGGEFGPGWHKAALKQHRHRAFEDFAAVAEKLVDSGMCRRQTLGIMGGSNGGLLVGNMLTRYPHLFAAVVCMVPLLDMQRYTKLLAGASWEEEFGDPDDPQQWAYLQKFSPYHNIDPTAKYPPVLLTTSTRDDRVHPGHARKMAEALKQAGHPVHYYENVEGGHGGAANAQQSAFLWALVYRFFVSKLSSPAQ